MCPCVVLHFLFFLSDFFWFFLLFSSSLFVLTKLLFCPLNFVLTFDNCSVIVLTTLVFSVLHLIFRDLAFAVVFVLTNFALS